jgi:hypothetical protein
MVMKDQTFCPKCHRMYCEGYWDEGVCTADMQFSDDATARGDEIAGYVRVWYEKHREGFWERHGPRGKLWALGLADEFMLSFIAEVWRVEAEAKRQKEARLSKGGVE